MSRPPLKTQLAFPATAAAALALSLYLLHFLTGEAFTFGFMTEPRGGAEWAMRLASILLWLSAAFVAVRALNELVFFVFRKRRGYEAPSLVRDIFSLVLYVTAAAFILKFHFAALSFGALLSGSALLGIILGLALQDTLGNLFSGVSLHADKPFQVGDVITVGKWTGIVESITWRAVKIKTFQNHFVLISNSTIAKENIEVCPRDNANARIVFFNALYTDSPVRVINAVREAVRECDNVLRYMTPVVRVRGLGDNGVDYEVKYWLSDYARYNDTDALLRQRIWYAFRRAGLSFAYPTRTLYLQRPSAEDGDGDRRARLTERLSGVDIFAPLSADELAALARGAKGRVFAPGETIIRAGDGGASMFVVHRGSVDVSVEVGGEARAVKHLGEGDFFGEMALLTGEPRSANVLAAEETEVLEIGHEDMRPLFESNPDLVEALSHTINERRAGLAATSAEGAGEEATPAGLIKRIRRFFRLD
ncbi:MAG TPA: mechanosensitive ion channel family protein [Pyrinomonadaceae bacterium]|nr:mechanosensitive ion channel family protein [Pyrinomonadaceae bacterium]